MSRSGSQKRRLTDQIKVACTPEQKAKVQAIASKRGHSASALCLNTLLGTPLTPAVRSPTANAKAIALVLGQLGKIGSNINQIAYHLNAGRPGDRMEGTIEEALRDLMEMRLACLQCLGFERNRKVRANEKD
jgi:hypothetical protein